MFCIYWEYQIWYWCFNTCCIRSYCCIEWYWFKMDGWMK